MQMTIDLNNLKQLDLARIFNKNERTIQRWHEQGLPRHGEGRGCTYVWAEVLPWYVGWMSGSGSGDELTDREREQKAKADKAEMEAAEMAGTLIRKDEAVAAWSAFLGRLKQNFLGLADRVAPSLLDGMVLAERVDVIRKEVNHSLRSVVAELEGGAEE